MVIAKILVHLRQTEKLALGRIIATHIDYANRDESGREAQFIRFVKMGRRDKVGRISLYYHRCLALLIFTQFN